MLTKIKDVSTFTTQNVEVALSVTEYRGKLYGTGRVMNTTLPEQSKLVLYELGTDFSILKQTELCEGEDARLFTFKDELLLISWTYNFDKRDLDIFILNPLTGTKTYLKHPELKFAGKNWTPYAYQGELFLIYLLQPLVVLRLQGDTVVLHYSELSTEQLNTIGFGTRLTLAAGSPGREVAGKIHLFTRTSSPMPHRLHYSVLDPITMKMEHTDLEPMRSAGVHDPYGQFEWAGKHYISTTESDDLWNTAEVFINSIYQVTL